MRKILCGIVLGSLLGLTTNFASAQSADAPPPPPRGEWGHGPRWPMDPSERAAHMAKHLSLTSQQQSQVQSILTSEETQMKALNESQTITHQQWLTETKALHKSTRTQIDALLTDTQKAQMKEHRGSPEGMGERPAPPADPN
jgi:periplasmic protein CpxP/Spy